MPDDILRLSPVVEFTGYTWIGGSWTELIEAQAAAFEYHAEGYDPFIIPVDVEGARRYRVAFGRFATREEASRNKPDMPTTGSQPWIEEFALAEESDAPIAGIEVSRVSGVGIESGGVGRMIWNTQVAGQLVEASPINTRESAAGEEAEETRKTSFWDRYLANRTRVDIGLLSQYESNIDHIEDGTSSVGYIPALFVRYEVGATRRIFVVNYYGARHDYTNTDNWDRWSHYLNMTALPNRMGRFRFDTALQLSRTVLSEERQLSDEVQVRQRVEYRFSRSYRLRLYGSVRREWYQDDPESNAWAPNLGVSFRQIFTNGSYWLADARWEKNSTEYERDQYNRLIFLVEYDFSLSESDDAQIEVIHRRRAYDNRIVEVDGEDVLRYDVRWGFGTSWVHNFGDSFRLLTRYRFDRRTSNDPRRFYSAHRVDLGLVYRL